MFTWTVGVENTEKCGKIWLQGRLWPDRDKYDVKITLPDDPGLGY
ncbi:MAG: hypothetical protein ACLTCP_10885 [Ruminococcus bicirculans (ex Wegman et al. 2014)]